MKLYNIFEGLILEAVSTPQAIKAIKGGTSNNGKWYINRYDITYDGDGNTAKGRRQIEIYALGTLKNRAVIRAYQIWGDTQTEKPQWKLFYLDKIVGMEKTGVRSFAPISDYDSTTPDYVSQDNGGGDKRMDGGKASHWVEFPEDQRNKAANSTSDRLARDVEPQTEPQQVEPQQEPTADPNSQVEPQQRQVEPQDEPTEEPIQRREPVEPITRPEDEPIDPEEEEDNDELK